MSVLPSSLLARYYCWVRITCSNFLSLLCSNRSECGSSLRWICFLHECKYEVSNEMKWNEMRACRATLCQWFDVWMRTGSRESTAGDKDCFRWPTSSPSAHHCRPSHLTLLLPQVQLLLQHLWLDHLHDADALQLHEQCKKFNSSLKQQKTHRHTVTSTQLS